MKTFHVSVTAEDIAHGDRRNCDACPVALAINRVLTAPLVARVGAYMVEIRGGAGFGFYERVHLPSPVQKQVLLFDQSGLMDPLEFDLEVANA
jgi:hypothetical protein